MFTFDNKYFRMMLRKNAIKKAYLYAEFERVGNVVVYWSSGKTAGHEQAGRDLLGRAAESKGSENGSRLVV